MIPNENQLNLPLEYQECPMCCGMGVDEDDIQCDHCKGTGDVPVEP